MGGRGKGFCGPKVGKMFWFSSKLDCLVACLVVCLSIVHLSPVASVGRGVVGAVAEVLEQLESFLKDEALLQQAGKMPMGASRCENPRVIISQLSPQSLSG